MSRAKEMLGELGRSGEEMRVQETEVFAEQRERMSSLEWISIAELAVICGFGAYQYYKLRSIIDIDGRTSTGGLVDN
jgi:hypothetical protein